MYKHCEICSLYLIGLSNLKHERIRKYLIYYVVRIHNTQLFQVMCNNISTDTHKNSRTKENIRTFKFQNTSTLGLNT